jgi:hypothetical protein
VHCSDTPSLFAVSLTGTPVCPTPHVQVHPAPGPEEVNWQHVWMSGFERDLRTAFTWPLTILLVLFPITLVTSAVSRLEYVFCPHGGQDNVSSSTVIGLRCTATA